LNQIEDQNKARAERIAALEKELADLRKERDSALRAKQKAEEGQAAAERELGSVREARSAETSSLSEAAKELMASYRHSMMTIGSEVEVAPEADPKSFFAWLRQEFSAMEERLRLGRDFSAVTAFKAICTGLIKMGCPHVKDLDADEVMAYWHTDPAANEISRRFFAGFWSEGGNDLAAIRAACSRSKVCFVF
jgi:hypothetical protein